jgi:hypothetical protein
MLRKERGSSRMSELKKRDSKANYPRRNEAIMCPGLYELIEEVALQVEGTAAMFHAAACHEGAWEDCGVGECSLIRAPAERLRTGLAWWGET